MKRAVLTLAMLAGSVLPGHAVETDGEFATRLQQHLMLVTRDPRIVEVAREASPSNVTVEFKLDADGRVGQPKVVHSILSTQSQQQVLDALAGLPPIELNGYVAQGTYRLPLRLDYSPPPAEAPQQ